MFLPFRSSRRHYSKGDWEVGDEGCRQREVQNPTGRMRLPIVNDESGNFFCRGESISVQALQRKNMDAEGMEPS